MSDYKKPPLVKSGRWSADEQRKFLIGLRKYGKGSWKQIGAQIPTRSLIQVKSHAQKVIKKIESGEDVFSVLDGYHADENDGDMAFHDVVPPKTRLPAARSNGPRRTRARSFSNGSSSSNKSQSYDIMSSSEDEDAAHALSFMHNSPVDGMRPMAPPPCGPPNFSLDAPMMPMNGGHSAHPHMPLNHPQSYGVFSNGMGGMVLGRPEGYVGGASHQPLHHQQPSHHQTVQPTFYYHNQPMNNNMTTINGLNDVPDLIPEPAIQAPPPQSTVIAAARTNNPPNNTVPPLSTNGAASTAINPSPSTPPKITPDRLPLSEMLRTIAQSPDHDKAEEAQILLSFLKVKNRVDAAESTGKNVGTNNGGILHSPAKKVAVGIKRDRSPYLDQQRKRGASANSIVC